MIPASRTCAGNPAYIVKLAAYVKSVAICF
jgi:hypothetical protein